jgi:hypothetical protein
VTLAPPDPRHTPEHVVELSVVEQTYEAVLAVNRRSPRGARSTWRIERDQGYAVSMRRCEAEETAR